MERHRRRWRVWHPLSPRCRYCVLQEIDTVGSYRSNGTLTLTLQCLLLPKKHSFDSHLLQSSAQLIFCYVPYLLRSNFLLFPKISVKYWKLQVNHLVFNSIRFCTLLLIYPPWKYITMSTIPCCSNFVSQVPQFPKLGLCSVNKTACSTTSPFSPLCIQDQPRRKRG